MDSEKYVECAGSKNRNLKDMVIQCGQRRLDSFQTEISKSAVRLVLEVPFVVLLCLSGALGLVACSPGDAQREKDKADRQAVVGVWSGGTANKAFGIVSFNPDGSFWASNTFGTGPSARGLATTGTWNIINGLLVSTQQEVGSWNWGTRQRPQLPAVDHCRLVWVTDQELALALDDEGLNIHVTNILHKGIESEPLQSSAALEKAKKIKLSAVKFEGLPLAAVITMLQDESVKRDVARKGVTISLGPDASQLSDVEVNLALRDITLAETLGRVADSVGLEIQAADTELLLVRKKE